MTYQQVSDALKDGISPELLCETCPWDRFCITPPQMTSAEIEAKIRNAKRNDEEMRRQAWTKGKDPGWPVGTLLAALTFSGRDTHALICPVLSMKLRVLEGRRVVDLVKSCMQGATE